MWVYILSVIAAFVGCMVAVMLMVSGTTARQSLLIYAATGLMWCAIVSIWLVVWLVLASFIAFTALFYWLGRKLAETPVMPE